MRDAIAADVAPRRFVVVERHELGPRLYVAGRRIHEYASGLVLIAAAVLLWVTGRQPPFHAGAIVGATGGWLVAKDWNDLIPARRDTTRWTLWRHHLPHSLRTWRRASWLPGALGALTGAVGIVAAASALAPGAVSRYSFIASLGAPVLAADVDVVRLPLGVLLMALSVPIARRRRRAWAFAVGALLAVALLDVLRGPALEEALLVLGLAAATIAARAAFHVDPDPGTLRVALRRGPAIAGVAYAVSLIAVWAASGHTSVPVDWRGALTQAAAMLVLMPGPVAFTDDLVWLPAAVGAIGFAGAVALGWAIGRPLRTALLKPDEQAMRRGGEIVRTNGHDTLSFFKLRRDTDYLFNEDHRAFLSYRVEAGVLIVSGDPVGVAAGVPGLVRDAAALAERQGLKLAVLGAGPSFDGVYRAAGLRSCYLGDEAIIDTATFTLDGRRMRKVRQSVTRLERAGYHLDLHRLGEVPTATLQELDAISCGWRGDAPERGFSMALDGIGGTHQADTTLIVARDASGAIRGFLHLVPCFGRPAVSLAAMRRDRDTVNGLTEYMVARGVDMLQARGVREVSLNFVVFARWLRDPHGRVERLLGKVASSRPARHYQIASLHRFSAKFHPRWERRDLWFEGLLGLPRAGVAALLAEGQIPRLCRPRWGRRPPLARHHSRHVRLMAPSSATPTVPPVEAGSGLANEERSAST